MGPHFTYIGGSEASKTSQNFLGSSNPPNMVKWVPLGPQHYCKCIYFEHLCKCLYESILTSGSYSNVEVKLGELPLFNLKVLLPATRYLLAPLQLLRKLFLSSLTARNWKL